MIDIYKIEMLNSLQGGREEWNFVFQMVDWTWRCV